MFHHDIRNVEITQLNKSFKMWVSSKTRFKSHRGKQPQDICEYVKYTTVRVDQRDDLLHSGMTHVPSDVLVIVSLEGEGPASERTLMLLHIL